MKSFIKISLFIVLIAGVMLSVTSCGSQKMGCPGSITKAEQTSASHS
ncbi:MAG: hypothetical protein K1X63_08895 [Chitinophagales bacterium]|nr:hypothetical protein [Bacteroidota bacterium]MBX7141181.1 hypothetical protein [Chitinophagales bacterium]